MFSNHSIEQMRDRGTDKKEVEKTIREGEKIPAKKDRIAFRKSLIFNSTWKGKKYKIKQVMPVVKEEDNKYVVITVYVFYFGGD